MIKIFLYENIMHITEFNIHISEEKFDGSASNSRMTWRRKQAVLIEIKDNSGRSGWGECWTFDQSADALIRFIQTEIQPWVSHKTIESIDDFCQEIYLTSVLSGRHGMLSAALSGVNCALWDLHAQASEVPLWQALNPNLVQTTLPDVSVYASGGLYMKGDDPQVLQAVVSGYVKQGFRTVKMKFGAKSFEDDLARITEVRRSIGPDIELILDAVYSLDKEKAIKWLPHWRELDVQAIQAPFPASDWAAMSWLNQEQNIPVMGFEAESRFEVFRALLQVDAIGILQFSPIAVGGYDASFRLVRLAEQFGKKVSLQCSSTWLAEMICFHLAAASQSVMHAEFHQFHQFHQFHRQMFDVAAPKMMTLTGGKLGLSSTPGLGFVPPKDRLLKVTDNLPDLIVNKL